MASENVIHKPKPIGTELSIWVTENQGKSVLKKKGGIIGQSGQAKWSSWHGEQA